MERRTLEAVIYEREPPIARIIVNRPEKANTKNATLVQEVDDCLHGADRDRPAVSAEAPTRPPSGTG